MTNVSANPALKLHIDTIRTSLDDIKTIFGHIGTTLGYIGNFTPFFDQEWLKQNPELDDQKINFTYLRDLGNQLVQDHTKLARQAQSMLNQYQPRVNSILSQIDSPTITQDELLDFHQECFTITDKMMSWKDRYRSLIEEGIGKDILNHITAATISQPTP